MEKQIYPIHAEAHALPYAENFFDAIVSMDSYQYYGTDDLYLSYFHKFLKPGGQIGIVVPGLAQDIKGKVPAHLMKEWGGKGPFWVDECWCFHTADWWQRHWNKLSIVKDIEADLLTDGWKHWIQYEKACAEAGTLLFPSEVAPLEEDAGRYMALVRVTGKRKEE